MIIGRNILQGLQKMNGRNKLKMVLVGALSILSMNAAFAWELEISGGRTGQSQTTGRIAINQPWDAKFWESNVGYFSGYWSGAYTYWEKGKYGKGVSSLSFSPVLTYNFYTNSSIEPFVELGVGVAAFSKTKVGDRNLGSALHFEDRFGVGARYGDHTVGVRAIHYSNAGIKKPNQGIESYSLYYSYKF